MALSHQTLSRLLRLVTLIVPLTATLIPNLANAEVKTGIEALDELFTQFVEGKNAERSEALDAIAALERDDTREILTGILEGDLMLHKSTDTIVWATLKGREYSLSNTRTAGVGKYWMTTADAENREHTVSQPADVIQYLPQPDIPTHSESVLFS